MASKTNEQKAKSVLLKSDVSKNTWSLKLEVGVIITQNPAYSTTSETSVAVQFGNLQRIVIL